MLEYELFSTIAWRANSNDVEGNVCIHDAGIGEHLTRTRVRARRGDEQTRGQREGVVRMRQRLRVSVRESACVRAMMSPGVSDGSPNNETPKTKK